MDNPASFTVTCPCCGSILTVDGENRLIVEHTPPPNTGEKTSFEERMHALDEEKRIAEEKFQESIRAEKSKKDVLAKKFEDLFQKAKEAPAGPLKRDIDLD
jgi:hypothetical protein